MKNPSVKNKYNILDVITTKGKNPKSSKFEMTITCIKYHPEIGIYYQGFDSKAKKLGTNEPIIAYDFAILQDDAKLVRRTRHK